MNFYMVNEQLEAQIKELKKLVRLSMNGVVTDSMAQKGVVYKHNYGVSVTALRDIAKRFPVSADLSNRLWLLAWRETLLLSVFLEPADEMSELKALERVKSAPEKEIIDCMCLYLLNKVSFAPQFVKRLIDEDDRSCQIASFMLAARIYDQLDVEIVDYIISKAIQMSDIDEYNVYKSIAVCLGRFCRLGKVRTKQLEHLVVEFSASKCRSQNYIAIEVKQELEFFIDL